MSRRHLAAHDIGQAVNPLGVEGQVEGGALMGFGMAHLERIEHEGGRILNANFADYAVPSIKDRLPTETIIVEDPNSPQTLKAARKFADHQGCGIQINAAEIPRTFLVKKYGKSAPRLLEEIGLLGRDVLAVHCIDVDDEDLEIFERNGVNVVHTPMTNSLGGNGVARVPEMLERGINVSLGHDCFFTLDTSEYIRYAYLLHKAHNADPMLLPSFEALDLVLSKAARALGLEESIGSLAAGKRADILIIRPDSPTPIAPSSVISYFTMTFLGREVETVLVDGQVVVEKGRMRTVDEGEVLRNCQEEAKKLWRKNGIDV